MIQNTPSPGGSRPTEKKSRKQKRKELKTTNESNHIDDTTNVIILKNPRNAEKTNHGTMMNQGSRERLMSLPSTSQGRYQPPHLRTPNKDQTGHVKGSKDFKYHSQQNKNTKADKSNKYAAELPDFLRMRSKIKQFWLPIETHETPSMTFISSNLAVLQTITFQFDIKPIHNPTSGFFIRKRSSKFKYIGLDSFGSNIPVVFISNYSLCGFDLSINVLIERTENISLNQSMSPIKKIETPQTGNKKLRVSTESEKKRLTNKSPLKKTGRSQNNDVLNDKKQPKKTRWRKRVEKKVPLVDYLPYLEESEVEGLANSSLIKGHIRINQRNHNDAYVTNIIKGDTDYCIKSLLDQNRALDGDEVVLRIKPETEWDEGRKTAVVVFISKMVHSRTSIGTLVPLPKLKDYAAFIPRDKRFPTLHIPLISWPQGFSTDPQKFKNILFVAKITEWTNLEYGKGLIIETIGKSGDLKIENLALLKVNSLEVTPFGNDVLKCLPRLDHLEDDWLDGREDLRRECIFTIDPLTARDLDDAMSCKKLPDGTFEIGVHIADVSHYLQEGNELDKQVQWKATTIYMVDQVYHMLPVELCMSCSLLPGKDKLAFSVFWKMSKQGEILETRFTKTVMHSCVQLAYEHAQAIIDDPDNFDRSSFPKITNGYTVNDIKEVILDLYEISKNLREKRFENGALRIDQVKVSFSLNPETGLPTNYFTQEIREANRLIEEFMLLANISVAEKIKEFFPDIAFLRLHEPPKETMMKELKTGLESVGIHVDVTSAKNIQRSLQKYSSDDLFGKVRGIVLSHMFAKPMTRARYFCYSLEPVDSLGHYALNIPLYTHFTSPIRRYADIMVHRLLSASLGIIEKPMWDPGYVAEVAERCNLNKYNAKKAQEDCNKLYMNIFISNNGPFIRNAAVVDVKERTFDVIVLDIGEVVRIYTNSMEDAKPTLEEIPYVELDSKNECDKYQKKYWRMKLHFFQTKDKPAAELIIELFTLVVVELKRDPKDKKMKAKLLRPTS